MHWADGGSLTALRTLPPRLAHLPVMWLVSFREGQARAELRAAIESLEEIGAQTLLLGPLDGNAVEQVAGDLLGAEPDPGLLELTGRAHGSPFLLVELLRGLQEDALVRTDCGHATLVEAPAARPGHRQHARPALPAVRARTPGRARSVRAGAALLLRPPVGDAEPAAVGAPGAGGRAAARRPADRGRRPAHLQARPDPRGRAGHLAAHRAARPAAAGRRCAAGGRLAPLRWRSPLSWRPAPSPATRRPCGRCARPRSSCHSSNPGAAADLARRALELAGAGDPLRGPLAAETALLLHAAGRVEEGKSFAGHVLGEALSVEQEAECRFSGFEWIDRGLGWCASRGWPARSRSPACPGICGRGTWPGSCTTWRGPPPARCTEAAGSGASRRPLSRRPRCHLHPRRLRGASGIRKRQLRSALERIEALAATVRLE